MRASLSGLCQRFVDNRDTVKSAFPWDSTYMHPVCAAIAASTAATNAANST